MSNTKYPAIVFFLVVVISLSLPLFYYSRLPETVASHYNIHNEANSWMSKETFLIVQLALTVFLSAMFFSFAYFLPKMSTSMINMPNKEFWLSEERKIKSLSVMQNFMYWFGSLTILFLTAVLMEVCYANISGSNKLNSSIWIYLVIFLASIIFLTIKLFRFYSNTDNSNQMR